MNLLARAAERLRPSRHVPGVGARGRSLQVKGVAVATPEVAVAVAQLRAFQRDFEKVFLSLAQGLPILSGRVQALTAPLARLQDPGTGVVSRIEAQVEAMAEVSRTGTRGVLDHSEAGLAQARLLAEGAEALVKQLSSVQRVSLMLRLAGLNASFSVDGLGERGAAFSAVNHALIEVAESAASLAEVTGQSALLTTEAAARFDLGQKALSAQLNELTTGAEERSRAALAECRQVLARVGAELEEVTVRGGGVEEATGRIMAAIQHQDILRQGIDHVILVLEAVQAESERLAASARPAGGLMGFLRFQEQAGRLATDLLRSLGEQLLALVASVQRPVEGLGEAARIIAARTLDHDALERSLLAASEDLGEAFLALPSGGATSGQDEVGQLEAQLRALGPRIAALERIPLEIDMVSILLRSEIAHLDELAGLTRVTDELRSAGASLRELNAASASAVATVAARLPLVRAAMAQEREAWEALRELPARLEAPVAQVRDISATFRAHLERLQGAGGELDRLSSGLVSELAGFGRALSLPETVRGACERWCDEAAALQERFLELGLEPAEPSRSLATLIEGFTLYEHKQLALAQPGANTQQAGEPGELTLF